ncbi:phage tail tape measure protein [Pukyongiella litopenaei]|uniref:Phage tail tape measure protein n=1 Tax=Pukyongiella litopenaei TaxID=2605946 RepID=A0A2S0MNV9_9RHOB|nr:phage tail tape measure protein [Pukyongiella litopenaei]AVO37403.1 phage tail tape measure protein [Pukyongiella litopenaei]
MSSKNQRLKATITIGSVLDQSVKRNVGFLKSGLNQVGNSIKEVERRQRELDRQRNVLKRQGKSVEHLNREYEQLERQLRDLRRAQERWNRAAAASRRVGSTFSRMTADIGRNARRLAIGAGLAGGAIFGLAASTAELGDNAAKTADKLGIGIEELQELRYAAERSGVSTAAFDTALEKMQKNLGEAATGTGTAKDALEQLGLSAEQLITMTPEDALGVIADRMGSVETAAERAAIANDIFGRSGVGMINMLRGGARGLDQLREAARRTGYVLSEQAARDAEVFQDQLLDTKLVMAGLKNTVGSELMPVITGSMRRIGDALVANRTDVQRWAKSFAGGVERALPLIGEVATGLGRVTSKVWGLAESTARMVGGWENFGIMIGAVLASRTVVRVAQFGAAVFSLGKAMLALTTTTPLVVGGIRAIGAALIANPIGLAIAAIAGGAFLIYQNWENVGPWFIDRWNDVRTTFGGFADFVGGVFTGDLGRAWDGVKATWSGANAFWQGIWDGVGAVFKAAWFNVIKPVTDALGITEPIERAWSTLQSGIDTVLGAIGDVFDTVWANTIKPVIDGLGSVESVGAAWEEMKTALGSVLDWIGSKFEWLDTIITPVIDGLRWAKDKGGGVLRALGLGDDDEKGDAAQGKALGGAFRPGWLLTGERGPELKFENRSGYVANNRALRQLAGYADRAGSLFSPPRINERSAGRAAQVEALFARAAVPARAQSAANQVTQHITYTINAAGASAEDVIRLVERKSRMAAGNGLFDRAPATGPYGR